MLSSGLRKVMNALLILLAAPLITTDAMATLAPRGKPDGKARRRSRCRWEDSPQHQKRVYSSSSS